MTHKVINTENAPTPIGPYNQAREHNGFVFLSGQVALNPTTGTMVQESIEAETEQVLKNIEAILQAAGLSMENLIKTSIFLTDMQDFQKVNEVYARHFTGNFPARETVQVGALPRNARVEISCVAGR